MTAQDVAFTFRTAKTSQSSLDLTFLEEATAVDSTTVVFTLNKPTLLLPQHRCHRGHRAGTRSMVLTMEPISVGSGPYQFVQWSQAGASFILGKPTT
ncbi:MAG: ABC transporter substrate-binding protein [Oscillospiraceae bacterium]